MMAGRWAVRIEGAGLAGLSCAYRLAIDGWHVGLHDDAPSANRTLVLSEPTVELLAMVWDCDIGLLDDAWRLHERAVRWPEAGVELLQQVSYVVDTAMLTARLRSRLASSCGVIVEPRRPKRPGSAENITEIPSEQATDPSDWAIDTTGRRPAHWTEIGRRHALLAQVLLAPDQPERVCWMDAAGAGWSFLAPTGPGHALIQAMVPGPVGDAAPVLAALLHDTGQALRLRQLPHAVATKAAGPAIATELCRPGLIRAGSAAIRLDPLSGTGAGHAIRTGVLAAAVLHAIRSGTPESVALAHYDNRVRGAFTEHLAICRNMYAKGFGIDWADEIRGTETALAVWKHCSEQPYVLRLDHGQLVGVPAPSPGMSE